MPAKTAVKPRAPQVDFDAFLERAGTKERAKIEKHLSTADEAHVSLWKRVAATLGTLAPVPVQSVGNNAWRFFIPDGKYRMQVFALEDSGDGILRVYLPDVLSEAIKAKVLTKTKVPHEYTVRGSTRPLFAEALDAANTPEPPAHFKHMLGWNRKALRVTLPTVDAHGPHAAAAEALFTLAAKHWEHTAG